MWCIAAGNWWVREKVSEMNEAGTARSSRKVEGTSQKLPCTTEVDDITNIGRFTAAKKASDSKLS